MTAILPPVIWLPFVPALLLLLVPAGASPRRVAAAAVLMAGSTLSLVLWAAIAPGALLCGSDSIWRNDALVRTLVPLPAAAWSLVALRATQPGESLRPVASRFRRWSVSAQLAVAVAEAALRVDRLALLPPMLGLLLLLLRREEASDRERASVLGALPVMGAGVVVLSASAGHPARWSGIAVASHSLGVGWLLLLLPVLLLGVWAMLRPVLFGRSAVSRGLLRCSILPLLLLVSFRCLHAAPTLAPLVCCAGAVLVVLSLLLVPSRRDLTARVSLAVALQAGIGLVAVAIGGPGAAASAVMIVGFTVLLLPIVVFAPVDAAARRLRVLAVLVLIGLPPFGPFAAFIVLLVRLAGTAPAAAVLLLAVVAVSALSVLAALRRERPVPGASRRIDAWAACAFLTLLVALWLGLAMPSDLSDWLLAIGAGGR